MAKQRATQPAPTVGKGALWFSYALFLIFFANLIAGKCNVAFHWGLPHIDSVAEFLLLGAASTTLIVAALKREAAELIDTKLTAKEVEDE